MAMEYVVVFTEENGTWGAVVPDLPGCVAVADSREECEQLIREAIPLHVATLREHGEPVPAPVSFARSVRVA